MTWSLSIYGQVVSSGDCEALAGSPDVVNCTTLYQLVWKIDSLNTQFVTMADSRGGNFHAVSGELSVYLDRSGTYLLNGQVFCETVRSSKCYRLINGIKCLECSKYRDTLRATYHCWFKQQNQSPSQSTNHVNERWLHKREQKTANLKSKAQTFLSEDCLLDKR